MSGATLTGKIERMSSLGEEHDPENGTAEATIDVRCSCTSSGVLLTSLGIDFHDQQQLKADLV
jgi:hypothetical protein